MKPVSAIKLGIVGGGLTGLIAALALGKRGYSVSILMRSEEEPDGRTSALLSDSIAFLRTLELSRDIERIGSPLKTMRILDGSKRLVRAPQIDFVASEIGLNEFGFNFENRLLAKILLEKLSDLPTVTVIVDPVVSVTNSQKSNPNGYTLGLASSASCKCDILLASDGRNSIVRQALGIEAKNWRYPQIALVGNFTHTLPHHHISTEFHTETGPFTTVPLEQNRSSLVCVKDPEGAKALQNLDAEALNVELERQMHSILGKISLQGPLKSFPLSGMTANLFGSGSAMLIGEAAHVFPPIGAQGLNLGIRDIMSAMKTIEECINHSKLENCGDRYHLARSLDIHTRTASVDLLNRSLLSDFIPVQMLRGIGLYTLGGVAPLRRWLMKQGLAPNAQTSR